MSTMPRIDKHNDGTCVIVMKHRDGSGFAEMPIELSEQFVRYSPRFVKFVTEWAEDHEFDILAVNDEFMTDDEYYRFLVAEGVIKPDITIAQPIDDDALILDID